MGYTEQEVDLINRHLTKIKNVVDYGAQCLYLGNADIRFASEWYEAKGIDYVCLDLAGDNNAIQVDLSYPINLKRKFDLVVDSGSGEHIVQMAGYKITSFHGGKVNSIYPEKVKNKELGYYYGWLNKHNLLKVGGKMININPLTKNWPGHAYSYISKDFYIELEKISGYKILELGTMASSGNITDGWNVYCVLHKVSNHFPAYSEFQKLSIYDS